MEWEALQVIESAKETNKRLLHNLNRQYLTQQKDEIISRTGEKVF